MTVNDALHEGSAMRVTLLVTFAMALAVAAIPAGATTQVNVTRTCPIGGAKYESFEIMSTSQMGVRLDLRPIGPAAHLPFIECPNGFVVFKAEKDFTPEEIAKLTPVVASEEYQRMRTEHMIAYRIAHLRRALGESEKNLGWILLRAAWQAEDAGKESLRQTYLTEARRAYEAQLAANATVTDDWWTASVLLAEIARQQSRFTDAIAALDGLPLDKLPADNPIPKFVQQIRAKAKAGDAAPAPLESRN
jgi:hypothetical protein